MAPQQPNSSTRQPPAKQLKKACRNRPNLARFQPTKIIDVDLNSTIGISTILSMLTSTRQCKMFNNLRSPAPTTFNLANPSTNQCKTLFVIFWKTHQTHPNAPSIAPMLMTKYAFDVSTILFVSQRFTNCF